MRRATTLCVLGICTFARPSLAQNPPRRIEIVAGERGAVAHRLAVEFSAAGLVVDVLPTGSAVQTGAIRLILPEGNAGAIEVWADQDGRSVLIESIPPGEPLDTRALRAAELVRALALGSPLPAPSTPSPTPAPSTSLPLPAATAPPSASTPPAAFLPPSPSVNPWTPPLLAKTLESSIKFDIGLSGALTLQEQGPGFAVEPTIRIWPIPRVGAGLYASIQAVAASGISGPEGSATLSTTLIGAELATAPIRTARFSLVLSPGIGLAHVGVSGNAQPPFRDSDTSNFAAMFCARAEGRLGVAGGLHLTLGALGGVGAPPIEIRFAERPVSTWRGLGSFSLGISLEP